jgi:hypothetical protein
MSRMRQHKNMHLGFPQMTGAPAVTDGTVNFGARSNRGEIHHVSSGKLWKVFLVQQKL